MACTRLAPTRGLVCWELQPRRTQRLMPATRLYFFSASATEAKAGEAAPPGRLPGALHPATEPQFGGGTAREYW